MQKREKWVDIAKGIAIFLVMLGHSGGCPLRLKVWIYSFHMPLFFILSGFTLNLNLHPDIFLRKKARSLLVPYVCFSPLLLLFNHLVHLIKGEPVHTIMDSLLSVFLNWHLSPYEFELWFLISLFIADLILYCIFILWKKSFYTFLTCFGVLLLGFVYNKHVHYPLPWNLDVVFIAVGFIGLGYWFKQIKIISKCKVLKKNELLIITFAALIINFAIGKINFELTDLRIDMFQNTYGDYGLFFFSSIAGSIFVIIISVVIGNNTVLEYLGRNSLVFYILHEPIIYTSISFLVQLFLHLHLNDIQERFGGIINLMSCFLIVAIEIVLITFINIFIKQYTPFIIGKHKKM